jgi:hypothetical protein
MRGVKRDAGLQLFVMDAGTPTLDERVRQLHPVVITKR